MKLNIQMFAVVALTAQKVLMNTPKVVEPTAGDTDGVTLVQPSNDESTMIVVINTSTDTPYDLTVKVPTNGTFAKATADIVVEIAAGSIAMVMVESAKFLDVVSGKITLDVENAALKFVAFYNK